MKIKKNINVFLTVCLSMLLDVTSLTPFFFSSVFEKMITMVTSSSAQRCSHAEKGHGQPCYTGVEWRWYIWAKQNSGWCPPIWETVLVRTMAAGGSLMILSLISVEKENAGNINTQLTAQHRGEWMNLLWFCLADFDKNGNIIFSSSGETKVWF